MQDAPSEGQALDPLLIATWTLVHAAAKGAAAVELKPGDRLTLGPDGAGELVLGGEAVTLACSADRKGGRPAAAFRGGGGESGRESRGESAGEGGGEGTAELRGEAQLRATWRREGGGVVKLVAERRAAGAGSFADALEPLPEAFIAPDRYDRLRLALRSHLQSMADRTPVARQKEAVDACGLEDAAGGLTSHRQHCVMDLAMFSLPVEGPTQAALLAAAAEPGEAAEFAEARAAIGRHRFTVARVTAVKPGRGVRVDDLVFGGAWSLTDRGMSVSAQVGDAFAFRLLRFRDGLVSNGAAVPLPAALTDGLDGGVVALLAEQTRAGGDEAARNRLAAMLLRLGLAAGGDDRVMLTGP